MREAKKRNGIPVSSSDESSEGEVEQGTIILHELFFRRVVLLPEGVVMKTGQSLRLQEADALRVALKAQLPVPRVYDVGEMKDSKSRDTKYIRMDYIKGQTLQELWPSMKATEKQDIANQLRDIISAMRSLEPPPNYIGDCGGMEVRDSRRFDAYHAPACTDEAEFNRFLLDGLMKQTPRGLYDAFARRLRTNHRIVLSHCDLAPRNLMVHEGKIVGVIDWEDAGWYPEYWEYVKFFQRMVNSPSDWVDYSDSIFAQTYPDELVDHTGISTWQS